MKALIDKPLDEMIELEDVRIAMVQVKCPRKLDILVFYQLTRRLLHEDLNYDDERFLIPFYDTFYNESIKLLGCMVRCRVNVLYHLLDKIGKEPNKTNNLILNLTLENVTQHSRIVTTTHKGSSTPTKMSKIIGRQIH